MERRNFIKISALTGVAATLDACGRHPDAQLIRFIPEEELIPGIATCQECHNDSWSHKGFDAGAKCLECHQYHDWNKEKDVRRTIAGL